MPYLRANTDAPFGAMPYDGVKRVTPYNKVAGYATRISIGDFVVLASDGNVNVAAAGDTNVLGVAAMSSPASTANLEFLVYDDPAQLFTCQADDGGTALVQSNVGNNCDIIATAFNADTGRSNHEIDQSTAVATTAQVRIVELHPIEAGTFGANRKYIIRIQEHILGQAGTAGI